MISTITFTAVVGMNYLQDYDYVLLWWYGPLWWTFFSSQCDGGLFPHPFNSGWSLHRKDFELHVGKLGSLR